MFTQCRIMTFLATDTSVLSTALQQCSQVLHTLSSSVTSPNDDLCVPPVFSAISKEFEQTKKVLYRASIKRKRQMGAKSYKILKTGVSVWKMI